MKNIAAHLLKPGMLFSKPVYIDESNIFVPAGIPIREKDLENLKAMGIETVKTNGIPSFVDTTAEARPEKTAKAVREAVEDPEHPHEMSMPGPHYVPDKEPEKENLIPSFQETPENKGAYRTYMQLIERMNMELLRLSSRETITANHSIGTISAQIMQVVRNQREQFVGFILGADVKGFDMAKSAVNCAILAALMAKELKLPHHKTLNIIIGALLHDSGMLRLPKEITEKRGELSEAERQRMRNHPVLAHRIVTKELNYHDEVGEVVLQHHERWDGQGYPHGLTGDLIDKGARIVSIVDAFEAMVSQKSYRNPMVGNQAIKNLLADNSRRFDPDLLKAFVNIMGIYPIGSIVLLNNGVVARVSETRADAPLRPKVSALIDENKKPVKDDKSAVIDLLQRKSLYITKPLSIKEFSELNA